MSSLLNPYDIFYQDIISLKLGQTFIFDTKFNFLLGARLRYYTRRFSSVDYNSKGGYPGDGWLENKTTLKPFSYAAKTRKESTSPIIIMIVYLANKYKS